ncbi:hypothetical protein OsccyDRAFT_0571 [Leptolyngbyaceae cyanobacterium JSC-12]|nr:hypothetical protein OsccyDRAFT_0571 [Leptolyngbyaceae cyanobacterium JSC-12]
MLKEMCWLDPSGGNGTKILHLRTDAVEGWKPYTSFRQFSVSDHPVPNGSKGFATMQALLKQGWRMLPSPSVCAELDLNKTEK